MNEGLTVRDVMTREFVGVNEGDTVAGVADLMVDAGVNGAVVLRGFEPVGLVEARDVVELVAAGEDPNAVYVGDAMADAAASIDPDAPIAEAIATFVVRDARRLVVLGGGEVLGTVSEHDVVTAQSTFPTADSDEPRVAVPADASGVDDRFSTQSVCEACGSLAETLANVNGQLLCVDCREM